MTVNEAIIVNRMIDTIMYLRDQPLIRTNGICDDALCESLIAMADTVDLTFRRSERHRHSTRWSGDGIRRAWPKPMDWKRDD